MKKLFLSGLVLSLVVLLSGCASGPASGEQGSEAPPEWVFAPPESDDQYMYFVGFGGSKTGDMAEAESTAQGVLFDEIMKYLGQRVTSETTAEVRASVDSFETAMVQRITSSSSGRVAGLEMADRWLEKRSDGITLYLLARYSKTDLLREKKRLEQIFQEAIDAVAIPEQRGQELSGLGEYYRAAVSFLEASAAALGSDIENADIKFERSVNQAKESLQRISLVKINDNLKTNVGSEFAETFRLKAVAGAKADDPGIAGVPLKVVYKEIRDSGKKRIRSVQIKTDDQGIAAFTHPIPEFVGRETIQVELDMSASLEPLEIAPDDLFEQVESLGQIVRSKKVTFTYESVSGAAKIPSGIAVFDLDASGNPIALTETSAGLLEALTGAGFTVSTLPVAVTGIANRQDGPVVAFLKKNFSDQVERAIYGTARISDHEQDGQFVIIQVTGTIKVVDLKSETILLTINKTKRAQGTDAAAALPAAFKQLGEDIGLTLINQLR